MSPRGLGKGLSALIPGAATAERSATSGMVVVPIGRIRANPLQPRHVFEQQALDALATSIRTSGILQPLLVVLLDDGDYELIAGERRLRAAKLAGLNAVPVVIRDGAIDDREKLELALVENLQRSDLNPIDRALAFLALSEDFALTHEAIAGRVGLARSSVTHILRLLKLPEDMQGAIRRGVVSEAHAKTLAGIADPAEQRQWFERIVVQGITNTTVVRGRQATVHPRRAQVSTVGDPNLQAKEAALRRRLGARARITPRGRGGNITIEYNDAEELEGILRVLLE